MTPTAFLSYAHDDRRYVPLLKRILEFHRIGVWIDRDNIKPGANYREALDVAISSTDCLLIAVTSGATRSDWVAREVASFRSIKPSNPIVPLIFDQAVELDDVFDGLSVNQSISFLEDIDAGFRKLIEEVFEKPYLQIEDRRASRDRRTSDRRRVERRQAPVEQRLRIGMWKQFAATTGLGEYEEFGVQDSGSASPSVSKWIASLDRESRGHNRTLAIFRLAKMYAAEDSELTRYDFRDTSSGDIVRIDQELLAELIHRGLRDLELLGRPYNIYVVENLAFALLHRFLVSTRDRRGTDRREGKERRSI